MKSNVQFSITDDCKAAIETLKEALISQPVLKIFSKEANTELHTDASELGFGAILMQQFEEKWYPVYFYSKKTSESESKLHSYHLEIKAAYLAVTKLRHYLLGLKFNLVTDCLAFKQTSTKEEIQPSISRFQF